MEKMNYIKKLIHYFFSVFGLKVSQVLSSEENKKKQQEYQKIKLKWLMNKQIKTVLDIGANTGQFAEMIRVVLPDAMLYSFEPLEECYQGLLETMSKFERFKAFHVALSDQSGIAEMRKNEYSPSSSFLQMTDLHKRCFPYTKNEDIQKVSVQRLDDIAKQLDLVQPILIKIDVQGLEGQVIKGGKEIISQASVVITELSIEPLYENQAFFADIYQLLTELGFEYKGNYDQLLSPDDGSVLQVDGIFIKS